MRPARSVPTSRTRVARASRSESSRAASSAGRRPARRGAWRCLRWTPSSLARTDQEWARISSPPLSCSAGGGREGGARRPGVGEDLLAELELLGRGGKREERARVTHGQPPRAKIGLDQFGELEQAQTVGHAAAVLADPLAELLLRPRELGEKTLVGFRLFHRVEVFAKQVLDERQLERFGIGGVTDNGRDVTQPGHLCSPPSPLADDDLELLAMTPYDNGLEPTRA